MSLSDSSLQPSTVGESSTSTDRSPTKNQLPQDPHEEYENSIGSVTLPSSLRPTSLSGTAPGSPGANFAAGLPPVSPTSSISSRKLQQILFSESIGSQEEGYDPYLGGTSTSLYELSGSIESLDTTKTKEKKVVSPPAAAAALSAFSSHPFPQKKKDSGSGEVENLLGISLSSVHSLTSAEGVGVTVVRTASDGSSAKKGGKVTKTLPSQSSGGANKYWSRFLHETFPFPPHPVTGGIILWTLM